MKIRIIICLIIIMLLNTITTFATDEIYVWSNQSDITTSTVKTKTEEKTGNFLRIGITKCNFN